MSADLIGLTGHAGAGKDSVATGDRMERDGTQVIAWADMPAGSRAC
ncbi:hypothetical protein PEC18_05085 [Paucibacter sp. O1-1]|nr:hypothetical protein [Aquabacterium sp. OR-4]MCU7370259.1 hypothetical protein [Paucibacter sp. O1-1]MDA3825244.1 hypothetical protein [Paucibacter sp. O1-1]MDT7836484.1 hypothetical protein [Aquabacterium sp. OR-4]